MIRIGCIADDFTGASDWGSFFAEKGIRTVLLNGVPDSETEHPYLAEVQIVVIALKTRTAPTDEAVRETLEALRWLEEAGAQRFYIKYCSTFDCTPAGNIGPVVDAVMDYLGEQVTVLCPALPVNGRTTKDGQLFVNGVRLHESSMKDHPLTPMWDCRLRELMRRQSRARIVSLGADYYKNEKTARDFMEKEILLAGADLKNPALIYFVPDFYLQEQGEAICRLFKDCRVLTGGSGLCTFLADAIPPEGLETLPRGETKTAIIAGSCSAATLMQIKAYRKERETAISLDPVRLLNGADTVESIWKTVSGRTEQELLLYSSQEPEQVSRNQQYGKEAVSEVLEYTQAELAFRLLESGRRNLIVAGGETSGAITKRLGYAGYYIGESIAPGVPVLTPTDTPDIRLVLKSGNFGDARFFLKAADYLRKH